MKLSETYIFSIEAERVKLKKSLAELKEEDFIPTDDLMKDVTTIISFYKRRQLLPVDHNFTDLVSRNIIRFMAPDRADFVATMPTTIPAVLTKDPKAGKPIALMEGRHSYKAIMDKSSTSKAKTYECTNQTILLNQIISGAILYTLNKAPIDFNRANNNKLIHASTAIFCTLMRRVIDMMYNLEASRDGEKMSAILHACAEWFCGNVLDMNSLTTIQSHATRVVNDLSSKGWAGPGLTFDKEAESKIIACNFSKFCDLLPTVTGVEIPVSLRMILKNVASLFGAAVPSALEYFPFFAALVCSEESGSTVTGVNYKSLKDALRGRNDSNVLKTAVFDHINKNLSAVTRDR